MEKKYYGILMIVVSLIVAVFYTIWVPVSYLLNDGKEVVMFKEILPPPIWGIIIPVYLLIMIAVFIFGWIGWNIMCGTPQEAVSIKELDNK
jgi:succinate dehydrogenase hydrophobic anchor subunit